MKCQLFYCAIAWYYKTNMNAQWHTYYITEQKFTVLKKTIDNLAILSSVKKIIKSYALSKFNNNLNVNNIVNYPYRLVSTMHHIAWNSAAHILQLAPIHLANYKEGCSILAVWQIEVGVGTCTLATSFASPHTTRVQVQEARCMKKSNSGNKPYRSNAVDLFWLTEGLCKKTL